MNRFALHLAGFVVAGALALPLAAQQTVPPAPAQTPSAAEPVFPAPDPADFTASAPSKQEVMDFLHASWGYDTNRVYQVQRIAKTEVEGISNVAILVAEKGNKQISVLQFFLAPDGKHIITAGEILPFGANPYVSHRATLLAHANGPSTGAASKDLELVEFADLQCPHCKDAAPTMDKLKADFPNAHIVFENYPLVRLHPEAYHAAAIGACVAKLGGNDAFFTYVNAVYAGQDGLATADGATLTLNSAVSKAGQDPAKVEACSSTPETKATVDAGIKLAQDLGVNQTPSLAINGRLIPLGGVPYETLKSIITFQQKMDGPADK